MSRLLALAFVVAAFSSCNCGSGSNDAPPAPDSTTFDVTWKPTTVVLADADVTGSLQDPAPHDGVLRFRPAFAKVQALTAGTYFVVPTAGLFRATAVSTVGNEVDVTAELASLVDAAQSGHVAWDIGVHHVGKSAIAVNGFRPWESHFAPANPVNYTGTIGNYAVTASLTPDSRRTQIAYTTEHVPFPGGSLKIEVTGYVEAFRAQGDFQFSGGSAQSFTYGVSGYHADLTIHYAFTAIQGSTEVAVPIQMVWPFLIGPIPMYVSLGLSASMQSTFTAGEDSAAGTVHLTYDGDFGLNRAGALQPRGGLSNVTFDTTGAEQASKITAGVEGLLEVPKIKIGVGAPSPGSPFDANLWFKLKGEVVSNLVIPDPFATGKPSCLTVSCGAGAYYGGSISLFGAQVSTESSIFATSREIAKTGSACQ